MPWKQSRDPLFRGDSAEGLTLPDPQATTSLVEHILFLGGAGRSTPFHSTTESEGAAEFFAGKGGRVYRTSAPKATSQGVAHFSRLELNNLLRGKGRGKAKSSSALQVLQARRYVEQWAEHLLDFSGVSQAKVAQVVKGVYQP